MTNLVKFIQQCSLSLTVHLALVFHVFIVVAVMVMVCGHRACGRHGLWPSWYRLKHFTNV